jgi:hypothetical protein
MELYPSFQAILSLLAFPCRDCSGGADGPVRAVELYMPERTEARADVLYVAEASALSQLPEGQRLFLLCCGGDPPEAVKLRHNAAQAPEAVELRRVLDSVLRAFFTLSDWILRLQRSVIEQRGVQELLDESEGVIPNTVTVLDSSLKLLAFTKNILPDDPPNRYLLEHGFHSADTLEKFRKSRRFQEPENINSLVISTDRAISDYVTVKYFFKYFNELSVYVVMICNHAQPGPGLQSLFTVLIEFIRYYVDKGYPHEGKHTAFDSLMYDMLEGRLDDREEIIQRSDAAGLPCKGLFELYKVDIIDLKLHSLSFLATLLRRNLPDARVSYYQNSIIVLNLYDDLSKKASRLERSMETLSNMQLQAAYAVGVSNVFYDLGSFPTAFRQATTALLAPTLDLTEKSIRSVCCGIPVYRFEDCYLWHMMQHAAQNDALYRNNEAQLMLEKLEAYSRERNYDYVNLLTSYLLYERRLNEVAEAVHLHRNTVVYHVDKLQSCLGTDFSDPYLRWKLLYEIYRSKHKD